MANSIKRYKLVQGETPKELEGKVLALLASGWALRGDVTYGSCWWVQALTHHQSEVEAGEIDN